MLLLSDIKVVFVNVFPPPSRCHSLAVTYPRSFDADFFAPIIIIIMSSSSSSSSTSTSRVYVVVVFFGNYEHKTMSKCSSKQQTTQTLNFKPKQYKKNLLLLLNSAFVFSDQFLNSLNMKPSTSLLGCCVV